MDQSELKQILEKHRLWLNGEDGGERADLSGADLSRANLSCADLYGATGNLQQIKSLFFDRWPVTYTAEVLQIGCKRHPINDWFTFDNDRIKAMDGCALEWWSKYRDLIKQTIELSPAEPTNHENKEGEGK